jgi:hypothetical protein
VRHKGFFTVGVAAGADIADPAITASGRAEFAAVKNNLQVQLVPGLFGKQFF